MEVVLGFLEFEMLIFSGVQPFLKLLVRYGHAHSSTWARSFSRSKLTLVMAMLRYV